MDVIKALLLFLSALPFSCTLRAQAPVLHFQHLGKEEGLTDNSYNNFIRQDSRGFIWISSMQGCYRFDGSAVKHYSLPPLENGEEISQNVQSSFWEDTDGNLWFTTFSALHCYVREADTIRSHRILKEGQALQSNYHAFHLKSGTGTLWLKAGEYVFNYDIRSERASPPLFPTKGARFSVDTASSGQVLAVYACPWWNGTGLEKWARQKEYGGSWAISHLNEGLLGEASISRAIIREKGPHWLISNLGLIALPSSPEEEPQLYRPAGQERFYCWDGTPWGPENLILSARANDLWYFDTARRQFTHNWTSSTASPNSLSTDNPVSLYASPGRQLWVAHNHVGIDYSQFKASPFFNPLETAFSRSVRIKNIIEDPLQRIWVLTEQEGIFVFKLNGRSIGRIPYPEEDAPNEPFTQLSMDSAGTAWAIQTANIYRFPFTEDLARGKWEKVLTSENRLASILPEGPDNIWTITNAGVYRLLKGQDGYRLLPEESLGPYRSFEFTHFYKAGALHFFAPFESQSLWVLANGSEGLELGHKFPGLAADTYGATPSRFSDTTWVATEKGLWAYQEGQLSPILGPARFDGPCSIFSVFEDSAQGLWLSSNRGLWHFNPRNRQLAHFGQSDGLASESFSPRAALYASGGKIWLGSDRGLVVFHPDSLSMEFPVPRAHIEAMWANNVPYDPGFAISEATSIALNYRQNTLAFELKAVGFYQPGASQLKYRLLGYDDNWANVPNGGYARFTKIPPGKYTLEILPLNAHRQAGKKKALAIGIKPPFWQTLWFRTAAVLAVLLLVAAIIGAYYRRKLRKQREMLERQRSLNEERNRIARELHDDMGSSLSSILFLSEDLLLEEDSPRHEVERIFSLAETSLENMREIIWAMDTDKNTLQDLSIRLRAFATDFLTDNKIRFELDLSSTSSEEQILGGESRRNIYLIAKEALHNTVKHARPSLVMVRLRIDGKELVLDIQDDGRGFDEREAGASGHGLNNMHSRANAIGGQLEIRSAPGKGTLLRLAVPL